MTETSPHNVGSAFWRTVTTFDRSKIVPHQALRNAIGVALPLIAGFATGMPRAGLAVATGALYVSYSDGSDPYQLRARRMLAAGFGCSLAVFLGAMSAGNSVAAVLVTTAWAFAAGLLVSLGTAAANIGMISLVSLVIFEAQSLSSEQAAYAALLTMAGAVLQTLLSIAAWPVTRYGPERRLLAALYNEMARIAETPLEATSAPPASRHSTQAQDAFASLGTDRSPESLRFLSLLNQAERMRLSLLILTRLRLRLSRENPSKENLEYLDRYLPVARNSLEILAAGLSTERLPGELAPMLKELGTLPRELQQKLAGAPPSFGTATAHEARFQMDALAGQLRATADLISRTTPAGEASFARADAAQPVWLRYSGRLATLRANLNFGSAAFRHALRLAICVCAGEILSRAISLNRSYWLVMTLVIVLKPDFSSTFSRGLLRIGGTLAGLVLATVMFQLHPTSAVLQVSLIFVLTFLLRWVGPANYGIFTIAISALIVLFFAINGISPDEVIALRGINTVVGGGIALLAYALWPTWEREQISETIARLLESYRDYFRAVTEANFHPHTPDLRTLDRTRLESRRARSNLEASVERLLAEPGTREEHVQRFNAILASSHRFAHAAMALDAYRERRSEAPGRRAFLDFAADVERVLTLLAATLRSGHTASRDWPDLRDDYHRLIQSGDPTTERYAFTNVEADRITNSLNTLRDQILSWTESRRPGAASAEAELPTP